MIVTMSVDEARSVLGVPQGHELVGVSLDGGFLSLRFAPYLDPWQAMVKPREYHHPVNPRADTFQRDTASLPHPYSQ